MQKEFLQVNYPSGENGRRTVSEVSIGGLLSTEQIVKHIEDGNIVIDPYSRENVGGTSVDVCLGKWFYRENSVVSEGLFGKNSVNIWNNEAAEQLWSGPFKASTVRGFLQMLYGSDDHPSLEGENLSLDDRVIVLKPGENILTHTHEFIGGNQKIGTSMQARSSLGRSHVSVCRCAGWGDPGYINRWTMEVTNNSVENSIVLVVGRRVAQVVFWEVEAVSESYAQGGKYQEKGGLEELQKTWTPEAMLPRLYLDRELPDLIARTKDKANGVERGASYAIPPRPSIKYSYEDRANLYYLSRLGFGTKEIQRILEEVDSGSLVGMVVNL